MKKTKLEAKIKEVKENIERSKENIETATDHLEEGELILKAFEANLLQCTNI